MADVKALFWDNGGVILTNGWDRDSRKKAVEKFHLDWDDFEDRHELMLNAFECGDASLDEYLQRTVFYRERPFKPEEFKQFMFEQSQLMPEGMAVLADLAAKGRYLQAALNNESLEINDYRVHTFHLRDYFKAFFSSCYLGVRKPHRGHLQSGAEDHAVRAGGVRVDRRPGIEPGMREGDGNAYGSIQGRRAVAREDLAKIGVQLAIGGEEMRWN